MEKTFHIRKDVNQKVDMTISNPVKYRIRQNHHVKIEINKSYNIIFIVLKWKGIIIT